MKTFHYIFYFTLYMCVESHRIGGGVKVTDPTKFPFYAMFIYNTSENFNTETCGGSLIHPQWILTAGHCLPEDPSSFPDLIHENQEVIFMGSVYRPDIKPPDQARKIIEIHRHPQYVFEEDPDFNKYIKRLENDIALLKLEKPFELSNRIQVIPLSTSFQNYKHGVSIGIGSLVYEHPKMFSKIVKYAVLETVKIGYYPYNQSSHIYTETDDDDSEHNYPTYDSDSESGYALSGDSGGPFICLKKECNQNLQIGVISWSIRDDKRRSIINAIERVDYFIDFIKQHLPRDKYTKHLDTPKKDFRAVTVVRSNSARSSCTILFLSLSLLYMCSSDK